MKRCPYCDKVYPDRSGAQACARGHDPDDVVHISFLKEDFQRLVQFIMVGERDLITERIYEKLTRPYKK